MIEVFGLGLVGLFGLVALCGLARVYLNPRRHRPSVMKAILIVKVSSLGDVIHNIPMLYDLRVLYPQAQIDWVVEEAFIDLLTPLPGLTRIIPLGLRRWKREIKACRFTWLAELYRFIRHLRAVDYDLILDAQGLVKSALVARLAKQTGVGTIVGLANRTADSGYEPAVRFIYDQALTVPVETHDVDRSRFVAGVTNRAELGPPKFYPCMGTDSNPLDLQPDTYVLFFHATAGEFKKWDRANWIQLGQHLSSSGLKIILPWGDSAEQQESYALAAQIPGALVPRRCSLREYFPLIRQAKVTIGVDTGLMHLAAALNCPTVEIYVRTHKWKTEGYWHPCIANLGDKGCPPSVTHVLCELQKVHGLVNIGRQFINNVL